MGAGAAPVVASVTATLRIRVAPLVWMIAAVVSVVAAVVWPAGPLIVGGVHGEPFEIGPLPPGWSVRQTLRPEPAPELFVGFEARPTANMESAPTLEVRLERDDQVLWADRVRVIGEGMREYVATFAVPTDGADYRMVVRVLEARGGGVVLAGADIGEPTATTQLSIMEQPLRGFLALGHRMFQRVPPVRHLEAVSTAVEQWTVTAAAAGAVLAALGGAVATVLLRRIYGGSIAVSTATVGLASLVVWLSVAAVHLSVPLDTEAQIGVLRGLTPTGTAALLAFPFVVVLGVAAIIVNAPTSGPCQRSQRREGPVDGHRYGNSPLVSRADSAWGCGCCCRDSGCSRSGDSIGGPHGCLGTARRCGGAISFQVTRRSAC